MPQIRLLHDVFRLHRAAQHAVGHGEQQRTVFFKWISLHSVTSNARRHLNLEVRRIVLRFCDMAGKLGIHRSSWGAFVAWHVLRVIVIHGNDVTLDGGLR